MTKKRIKLLIVGEGRHGKDTMAEILEKWFDFRFQSSSLAAAEIFLYDVLKDKYNYKTFEECYEDRHNHRQEWFELISDYNKDDRMRLAKDIMKMADCYVGMRSKDELKAAKTLFDKIVWVDAGKRLPPEDRKSITINRSQADTIIDNNGTIPEFEERILELTKGWYNLNKNYIEQFVKENEKDALKVLKFFSKYEFNYIILNSIKNGKKRKHIINKEVDVNRANFYVNYDTNTISLNGWA